ncbi:MAG: translesion error-prone DNA polymerase V autoproteolytic subunit [Pedobacter sp.]|nr:MAG: translesion error-prone DNA polymerase V autoproteolytic subunit [Pedobacter sp.]
MTDSIKESPKRGGVRPSAGRKPQYDEPTAVIRVPVSKKQLVKDFLKTGIVHAVQGNAVGTDTSNTRSALSSQRTVITFPDPQQDLSSELPLTRVKVLTHYQIPVAQELIPAGFPSPAEDHIEDVLDLNEHLIRNKSATFVGRVGSLSMVNAGFDKDDEILIDRSIEARHKDIVIAMIDNKFTMKRLMLCEYDDDDDCDSPCNRDKSLSDSLSEFDQPIWFKAENPEFSNIYPQAGQTVTIIGVVTYNIKKVFKR